MLQPIEFNPIFSEDSNMGSAIFCTFCILIVIKKKIYIRGLVIIILTFPYVTQVF
jgi:hypothetical protein